MTKMLPEFRSATRGLRTWRGSVIAALTLAIGIGTATGLAAVARVLLADMRGVPDLHHVARIYAASPSLGVDRSRVALGELDATLTKATSFSAVGGYADEDALLGSGPDATPIVAGYASPGFFTAMGVPPAAGRVFSGGDLSGAPVVVLSHALWRRHFPDGRLDGTIVVDGAERTVIGVMPPEYRYPFVGIAADLWVPLTRPSVTMPSIVQVFARLKDDVAWPAAQAELAALSRHGGSNGQWTWHAIALTGDTRTRAMGVFAGTMGPALLVLIFACVNVACLLMARGIAREKELSVRRALGATRARIVAVLLVEHVALAAVSGALGAALAAGIVRVLASQLGAVQPSLAADLVTDVRLLPAAIGASALACLLFGVIPALRLSRVSLSAALTGIPAVHRVQIAGYGARDAVVFAEVACSVAFLVWAAMLHTLFAQLDSVNAAFPADRMVAMRVPADTARDVALRAAAVPGVARTAVSSGLLGGGMRERLEAPDGRPLIVSRVPVGESFFETLGLPIVRGRSFDAAEVDAHAGVVVLAESGLRQLAGGPDVVGMRLRTSTRGDLVVIGVCRDALDYGPLSSVQGYAAEMYVPYEPPLTSPDAVVLARTSADPHAVLGAIAGAAQTRPGTRPARPIVLSDDLLAHRPAGGLMMARMLASSAILALLLAATGVFAVISQSVAQRTREFGIRLAIGATPARVLRMVLAREAQLIGAAVATGALFSMLLTRALFVELAELNAIVPSMWVGALLLSGGMAAMAVAFATYRIVRLEPAVVLRRL
jgi:putative ABC transport system permease protein